MKFLLFVFAKHTQSQEQLVKTLAEDIVIATNSSDIKYYYGDESIIYTFESFQSFKEIDNFFREYLGGVMNVVFFFTKFEPDNMTYWLEPNIENILFNTDKKTEAPQAEIQNFDKVRKLLCDMLKLENEFELENQNIFTLDELLDKINDKGYESLTKEEKTQLENYSKQ